MATLPTDLDFWEQESASSRSSSTISYTSKRGEVGKYVSKETLQAENLLLNLPQEFKGRHEVGYNLYPEYQKEAEILAKEFKEKQRQLEFILAMEISENNTRFHKLIGNANELGAEVLEIHVAAERAVASYRRIKKRDRAMMGYIDFKEKTGVPETEKEFSIHSLKAAVGLYDGKGEVRPFIMKFKNYAEEREYSYKDCMLALTILLQGDPFNSFTLWSKRGESTIQSILDNLAMKYLKPSETWDSRCKALKEIMKQKPKDILSYVLEVNDRFADIQEQYIDPRAREDERNFYLKKALLKSVKRKTGKRILYPILREFNYMGQKIDLVEAAKSIHYTLAHEKEQIKLNNIRVEDLRESSLSLRKFMERQKDDIAFVIKPPNQKAKVNTKSTSATTGTRNYERLRNNIIKDRRRFHRRNGENWKIANPNNGINMKRKRTDLYTDGHKRKLGQYKQKYPEGNGIRVRRQYKQKNMDNDTYFDNNYEGQSNSMMTDKDGDSTCTRKVAENPFQYQRHKGTKTNTLWTY